MRAATINNYVRWSPPPDASTSVVREMVDMLNDHPGDECNEPYCINTDAHWTLPVEEFAQMSEDSDSWVWRGIEWDPTIVF